MNILTWRKERERRAAAATVAMAEAGLGRPPTEVPPCLRPDWMKVAREMFAAAPAGRPPTRREVTDELERRLEARQRS